MSVLSVGSAWRDSDQYAARAQQLRMAAVAGALAVAAAYAVALVAFDEGVLLLFGLLGAALVTVLVLARPAIGVYALFAGAVLFEQAGITGLSPITEQVHFFKGFDTFTAIPLHASPADLLLVLSAVALVVSHVAGRHAIRMGPFGWAVAGYGAVFAVGVAIGIARGSWNVDAAVTELRSPLQMCVMYFLAASLIRERRQFTLLLWMFALLVGVKALQGILNYQESLSLSYALEAVTGHEDVVFFDLVIVLSLVMLALGVRTRFAYTLLALQPLILGAEVLTQRRVGLAALGATLLVIGVLFIAANPRRALLLAAVGALAISAYVAVFWEQDEGLLGLPIRTLRAALDPTSVSARDQSSDNWRLIENRNIEFTIRALPATGVGVGGRYVQHEQPPSMTYVFEYWRYITHNALLWLWLKAGPLGGFALWFLVARVILVGSAMFVRIRDGRQRVLTLAPVALIAIQVAFSSVDMGLTHARPMIVLGTILGASAFLFAPVVPARPLGSTRVGAI